MRVPSCKCGRRWEFPPASVGALPGECGISPQWQWEFSLVTGGVLSCKGGISPLWQWELWGWDFSPVTVGVLPCEGGISPLWQWELWWWDFSHVTVGVVTVGFLPCDSGSFPLWGWDFSPVTVGVVMVWFLPCHSETFNTKAQWQAGSCSTYACFLFVWNIYPRGYKICKTVLRALYPLIQDVYDDVPDLSRNTTALGTCNNKSLINQINMHTHTPPHMHAHAQITFTKRKICQRACILGNILHFVKHFGDSRLFYFSPCWACNAVGIRESEASWHF